MKTSSKMNGPSRSIDLNVEVSLRNYQKKTKKVLLPETFPVTRLRDQIDKAFRLDLSQVVLFYRGEQVDRDAAYVRVKKDALIHVINMERCKLSQITIQVRTVKSLQDYLLLRVGSDELIGDFMRKQLSTKYERIQDYFLVYTGRELCRGKTFAEEWVESGSQVILVHKVLDASNERKSKDVSSKQKTQSPLKSSKVSFVQDAFKGLGIIAQSVMQKKEPTKSQKSGSSAIRQRQNGRERLEAQVEPRGSAGQFMQSENNHEGSESSEREDRPIPPGSLMMGLAAIADRGQRSSGDEYPKLETPSLMIQNITANPHNNSESSIFQESLVVHRYKAGLSRLVQTKTPAINQQPRATGSLKDDQKIQKPSILKSKEQKKEATEAPQAQKSENKVTAESSQPVMIKSLKRGVTDRELQSSQALVQNIQKVDNFNFSDTNYSIKVSRSIKPSGSSFVESAVYLKQKLAQSEEQDFEGPPQQNRQSQRQPTGSVDYNQQDILGCMSITEPSKRNILQTVQPSQNETTIGRPVESDYESGASEVQAPSMQDNRILKTSMTSNFASTFRPMEPDLAEYMISSSVGDVDAADQPLDQQLTFPKQILNMAIKAQSTLQQASAQTSRQPQGLGSKSHHDSEKRYGMLSSKKMQSMKKLEVAYEEQKDRREQSDEQKHASNKEKNGHNQQRRQKQSKSGGNNQATQGLNLLPRPAGKNMVDSIRIRKEESGSQVEIIDENDQSNQEQVYQILPKQDKQDVKVEKAFEKQQQDEEIEQEQVYRKHGLDEDSSQQAQ